MAITDEKDEKLKDAESVDGGASSSGPDDALATASDPAVEAAPEDAEAEEENATSSFGSERYVHAAFFVAGILAAYLSAKTIGMAWNSLAAWPDAVRAVPQLVGFSEEQRESYSLAAGAGIGTLVVIQSYRKESVRTWAGEVAAELSKVTWPTREAVMNGTLVVVVASALATVYVTILDKIWGFLTTLVYGA
jgi:preprotein translocase subunit SecE